MMFLMMFCGKRTPKDECINNSFLPVVNLEPDSINAKSL